mgnify:CR=1 FL=1
MPEGNLKFKFLPEREIQIFGQTDLVTKIARRGGVTVSFDKKQAATLGCVDWTTNFAEGSHSTFTT